MIITIKNESRRKNVVLAGKNGSEKVSAKTLKSAAYSIIPKLNFRFILLSMNKIHVMTVIKIAERFKWIL